MKGIVITTKNEMRVQEFSENRRVDNGRIY